MGAFRAERTVKAEKGEGALPRHMKEQLKLKKMGGGGGAGGGAIRNSLV